MMSQFQIIGAFVGIALAIASFVGIVHAEPPPIDPRQPHGDIFTAEGWGNLQQYNPVTVKAKATREIRYGAQVLDGCTTGLFYQDVQTWERVMRDDFHLNVIRDDANPDFVFRLNCGLDQATRCGSVNTFCLGRGFPGVADVDMSDIMYFPSLWPEETRISIFCHEGCGHAIATWDEQYCKGLAYPVGHICRGLARFTPAPGWEDFMNTGVLSRHFPKAIEKARWERTMYLLTQEPPPPEWCCDTTYPGWEGTVSRLHVPSGVWWWGLNDYRGVEQLRKWQGDGPWICTSGCP